MNTDHAYERSAGGVVSKMEHGCVLWLLVRHKEGAHWGFPKGHIGDTAKDETPQEAALREVTEETGVIARILDDNPVSVRYTYKRGGAMLEKEVSYYLMEYVSGTPLAQESEISDVLFVPEDVLLKMLTFENDRNVFRKLRALLSLSVSH